MTTIEKDIRAMSKASFQIGWLNGTVKHLGWKLGLSEQEIAKMIEEAEQKAEEFANRPR